MADFLAGLVAGFVIGMAVAYFRARITVDQYRAVLARTIERWNAPTPNHPQYVAGFKAGHEAGRARKPWERTDWTCAKARIDNEGMHCPENKCPDCPKRSSAATPGVREVPRG